MSPRHLWLSDIPNLDIRTSWSWSKITVVFLHLLCDTEPSDHFRRCNRSYRWMILLWSSFHLSKLLLKSEKCWCHWQFLVEDCHQWVEHLRRYSLVNVLILFIIHMLRRASCNTTFKYAIGKILDFFLIMNSVIIIDIFALSILI